MADFAGFEIETGAEVLARVQQRNAQLMDQAQRSRDSRSIDLANTTAAFNSLFGQFEVRAAEERNQEYTTSVASALDELDSDATPEQRERALNDAMLSVATKRGDLKVATQAAQKSFAAQRQERERMDLLADREQDKEAADLRLRQSQLQIESLERDAAREERMSDFRVAVLNTDEGIASTSFNVANDAGARDLEGFMASNPGALVMTSREAAHFMFDENSVSKHESADLRDRVEATDRAMRLGTQYLDILRENPQAFTTGQQLSAGVAKFVRNVESVASSFIAAADDSVSSDNQKRLNASLDRANVTDARLRGMAVNLAYALARSREPGGRLSDNDIQFAMQMIGGNEGNPDSRVVAQVLNDNVFTEGRELLARLERTPDRQFAGDIMLLQDRFRTIEPLLASFDRGDESTETTQDRIDDAAAQREQDNAAVRTVTLGGGREIQVGNN